MKTCIHLILAAAILSTFNSQLSTARAQGTAFTYQGRVTDNGTNFTGIGQFKFALVTGTNFSSQATATATVDTVNEEVTAITVVNGGSGNTTAPTLTFIGTIASFPTYYVTLTNGTVASITVTSGGAGVIDITSVIVTPPPLPANTYAYWSNDGTSVSGGEPSAAVNVAVNNGLFTVVLGDTNVANMTAIDTSLFAQPDLKLRIWFNDGVNGFAALDPPQNLTPAPYAVNAITASNLSGTVSAAQISGDVSSANFSGAYGNAVTLNNANNNFNGSFSGNGASLASLNANNISSGTVADARLSGNVALLNGDQKFTGINTFADNMLVGATNAAGQLTLGNYQGGTLGSAVSNFTKQVVLGGDYNTGYNFGNSVKLLISDYDNDPPSDIYPIYVEDENNGVDFYLHETNGVRTAYFGGSVTAAGVISGDGGGLTNLNVSVKDNQENVRIVRGIIDPNGNIFAGSGFTVVSNSVGNFNINFTTPFSVSSFPAVTVSGFFGTVGGLISENASEFAVQFYNVGSTTPAENYWSFIAIGAP
ncbi:MAG TPA: hypothetical protein VGH42_12670 [Verrucomicrobiae bacterium]